MPPPSRIQDILAPSHCSPNNCVTAIFSSGFKLKYNRHISESLSPKFWPVDSPETVPLRLKAIAKTNRHGNIAMVKAGFIVGFVARAENDDFSKNTETLSRVSFLFHAFILLSSTPRLGVIGLPKKFGSQMRK